MPVTAPGGSGSYPAGAPSWAYTYASRMDSIWPHQGLGAAFVRYVLAHRSYGKTVALNQFLKVHGKPTTGNDVDSVLYGPGKHPPGKQIVQDVTAPLSGLKAIGDFFSRLTQANTWIRVGEVLLGVILLAVGMARITGAQNIVSSTVKARI